MKKWTRLPWARVQLHGSRATSAAASETLGGRCSRGYPPARRNAGAAALAIVGAAVLAAVVGCERGPAASATKDAVRGNGAALPAGLFVATEPSGAAEVGAAKASASEGETIIVRGRIGGSASPFVEGRAVFTVADLSLPPCNANPDDACETPWDYCCEPTERITRLIATVQVVGSDGQPLKVGLQTSSPLKPLAEVVVRGRVSRKQGDQILVIDAAEIFVKKT